MIDKETGYPIGQLAEAAGVTPRTIRYYAAEGLLPPPDVRGRYALYSGDHLRRLQLIARLKQAFLPLGEIKQRLEQLTGEQVRLLLSDIEEQPGQRAPSSALDYIARALHKPARSQAPRAPASASMGYQPLVMRPAPDSFQGGVRSPEMSVYRPDTAQFSTPSHPLQLGYAEPATAPLQEADMDPLRGSGETWQRIALAPGVELHIREPGTPAVQERLAKLVEAARRLFDNEG